MFLKQEEAELITGQSRSDKHHIKELAAHFFQTSDDQQFRVYLLTYVFSPHRDRYYPYELTSQDKPSVPIHPTRKDVEAGDTLPIPLKDRPEEFMGDVRRHYPRILKRMFGCSRARYRAYHPTGIGWIDEPVSKLKKKSQYQGRRRPNDNFLHAHV